MGIDLANVQLLILCKVCCHFEGLALDFKITVTSLLQILKRLNLYNKIQKFSIRSVDRDNVFLNYPRVTPMSSVFEIYFSYRNHTSCASVQISTSAYFPIGNGLYERKAKGSVVFL